MKNPLLPCCLFLAASFSFTAMPASAQTSTPDSSRQTTVVENYRRIDIPPETLARWAKADQSAKDAAASLRAGRYTDAEAQAKSALANNFLLLGKSDTEEVLAAALDAQGKRQEALQVYQRWLSPASSPLHFLLSNALLLANSGHWANAVSLYTLTQSRFPVGLPVQASPRFLPGHPHPQAFRVAVYTELGFASAANQWHNAMVPDAAIQEYATALRLAPNNPLANYYFGHEWQRLDPAVRAEFGTASQAKAHLETAARLGSGDVKAAAEEALIRWDSGR